MTELTIEHEESIRKAAITAVTGIIAELQCCGHAAPDLSLNHLGGFQQLLAQLERGPRTALQGGKHDNQTETQGAGQVHHSQKCRSS